MSLKGRSKDFYINKIIPLCIRVMVDKAPVISHMYFTWRNLRRDLLQSKCKSTTVRAGAVMFPV